MSMSSTTLGTAIANSIMDDDAPSSMQTTITTQWQDIADIIISHIQDNATITVASGITVSTVGTSTAQTGTTTSTGTATIL